MLRTDNTPFSPKSG